MAFSGSLNFLSASEFVVYGKLTDPYIRWGKDKKAFVPGDFEVAPIDFVGLNTMINEPVDASSNFLGHSSHS